MKLFYSWSLITVLFPAIEIERGRERERGRGRGKERGRGGGRRRGRGEGQKELGKEMVQG